MTNPPQDDITSFISMAVDLVRNAQEKLGGIESTFSQADHSLHILINFTQGAEDASLIFLQAIQALLLVNLNFISDLLFAILKMVSVLLALLFVFILVGGVFKKVGLVIIPFEVVVGEGGKTSSGKAISDLLTSELQRIQEIHNVEFEERTIKAEKLSIPALAPKGESLEHSMPQMASLGAGSSPLSVGLPLDQLFITFKRLCPGSSPVSVLSGTFQTYGRTIALTGSLEDRKVRAWGVRRKLRKEWQVPEEYVPSMVRDLAYKITHTLAIESSKSEMEAGTWMGLKLFTEARECYRSYTKTGDLKELQRSRNYCIKSMRFEKKYMKAADLLSTLGFIFCMCLAR